MRGAIALSGVTLLSQAASALLSPIYARLYSPSNYGVVGVYSSLLTSFLTVGALCYEQGILLGRDDDEAKDIIFIAVAVTMFASLLSVILLSFGLLQVGGGEQSLIGPFLWFLPIGILWGGTYQVMGQWALRKKAIKVIAQSSVYQNAGAHTVMLGLGVYSPSPLGLILGGIVSVSAGLRTLITRTMPSHGFREIFQKRSFSSVWTTAKRYRRLPLIQAPSTLLNSIGLFLPAILMVSYYGTKSGGWLSMAQRFMQLPMSLIGGSISRIFFSEAADMARNNPSALKPFFDHVVLKALKITIVIALAGLTSPITFPLVFGEKWREAGTFAAWISMYCCAGLLVSPVSSIPTLVGKLQGQLIIDGLRALLVFLAFYVPHILGKGAETAVMSYSLVLTIMYLAYYLLYRHQVSEVSSTGRTHW
jgi:O-antigen/teichoic acid export membrane protein